MKIVYITETKNKKELYKLIRKEILKGNIVLKKEKLSMIEEINASEEEIENVRKVNNRKIEIAEEIIVINEEEGQREIHHAKDLNKKITFIEKDHENIKQLIEHDKKIIEEKSLLLNISKEGEILIPKEVLTKGYAIHLKKKLKLRLPIRAI